MLSHRGPSRTKLLDTLNIGLSYQAFVHVCCRLSTSFLSVSFKFADHDIMEREDGAPNS